MGRLYASPWAISLYETCPAKYEFAKIIKGKRPPRQDERVMFSGLVVHQVWEYFVKSGGTTKEDLYNWIPRAISARENTAVLPWSSSVERKNCVEGIHESVINSYNLLSEAGLFLPSYMEAEVQMPGSPVHGVFLTGRIDLVVHTGHKKVAIIDWKDGAASGADYFQLGLYQEAWMALGYEITEAAYVKTAKNEFCSEVLTPRRRSGIKRRLTEFREGVESGDFPHKCSDRNFKFCDYRSICCYGQTSNAEMLASLEGLGQSGKLEI